MRDTVASIIFRPKKLCAVLLTTLLLLSLAFAAPQTAHAQSTAAVQTIIATLTDYFKDVPAYNTMTTEQKAQYILTNGRNRIAGRVLDLAKSNLASYSEKVLRQKLMMQYINDVVAQQVYMTMLLEGEAAAKATQAKLMLEGYQNANVKIAALNIGANIGVAAIKGYLDGADKGKALSGFFWGATQGAGEAYMKAVLPGFSWIKLGVQAEAALIKYFQGYVMEEQVDCALKGIYGGGYMSQLAGQLGSKTRAEVEQSFESLWARDDGVTDVACGRYLIDAKTGKGISSFKDVVKLAVLNMKDGLDRQAAQAQAATTAIVGQDQSKAQADLQAAEAELKSALDAAVVPVAPALAKIEELRMAIGEAAKTSVREAKASLEQTQAAIPPVEGVPYTPLNRGAILGYLGAALSEIKDTPPSGYNVDTFTQLMHTYQEKREEIIKATAKKTDDDMKICVQKASEAVSACIARSGGDGFLAEQRCFKEFWPCNNNNGEKLNFDITILAQEEKLVFIDAMERFGKMATKLRDGAAKIAAQIDDANHTFIVGGTALRNEASEKLAVPGMALVKGYSSFVPSVVFGGGWIGIYEGIKEGTYQPWAPGSIIGAYNAAEANRDQAKQFQALLPEIYRKDRKRYGDYQTALITLRSQLQALVPKSMLVAGPVYNSDGQPVEWFSVAWVLNDYVAMLAGGLRVDIAGAPPDIPAPLVSLSELERIMAMGDKPPSNFGETITFLQNAVDTMRPSAIIDELAVMINRTAGILTANLGNYTFKGNDQYTAPAMFQRKEGKYFDGTPEESDGAAYLSAMKKAWDQYRPIVEKAQNWKKVYGKGLRYQTGDDPAAFLAGLDVYVKIPERIAIFEAAMATAAAERQKYIDDLEGELKKLQEQIAQAQAVSPGLALDRAQRIVLPDLDRRLRYLNMGGAWSGLGIARVTKYKQQVEAFILQAKRMVELNNHIAGAQSFLQGPDASGGSAAATGWVTTLQGDMKQNDDDLKTSFPAAGEQLAAIPALVDRLRQYLNRPDEGAMKQAVQELYNRFKEAYEARNDSAVVACLSSTWQAAGATVSDFQNNIRNTFRVFDEVRYAISNLRINKSGDRTFAVAYDVTITSKIYKRNLKHEEKSSVNEEVVIDGTGKAKIARTMGGRFWYVQ